MPILLLIKCIYVSVLGVQWPAPPSLAIFGCFLYFDSPAGITARKQIPSFQRVIRELVVA